MKKKIMILGASILQLPAIQKAKELGLDVVAVDMNPDSIGFKETGITCEIISTIDTEKVLEAAKRHNVDGIMTLASDMPMRTVAVVAHEMGLVGITEETALNATNKAVMRQCLKKNGVPVPEFHRVEHKSEYDSVIQSFKARDLKAVVKPVDNSGSRGIDLLSDLNDQAAVDNAYQYSKTYSRSGDILVEEYMEGPEVSVETLSIDGVCHVIQITDKMTTGAPFFVEMGHSEPSMLPEEIQIRIAEVASAAVNAIGIKNGPSHTEIKVTSEGPKIVELGARLGGDNITTHLVPLSTGVDMVENCIKIALGAKPDLDKKFCKGSAIRYIKAETGRIVAIDGLNDAKKIDGICQVSIVHGIGEDSIEIKSSVDRIGFVIAQSGTPEKAIACCEEAIKKIKVEVE